MYERTCCDDEKGYGERICRYHGRMMRRFGSMGWMERRVRMMLLVMIAILKLWGDLIVIIFISIITCWDFIRGRRSWVQWKFSESSPCFNGIWAVFKPHSHHRTASWSTIHPNYEALRFGFGVSLLCEPKEITSFFVGIT